MKLLCSLLLIFSFTTVPSCVQTKTQISEDHLGKKLKDLIKTFKIDTSKCLIQEEPPGISRGITVELPDSSVLYLQIERVANFKNELRSLMNKKITGIGIAYTDCSKKSFGEGFVWWGISNPYCKN